MNTDKIKKTYNIPDNAEYSETNNGVVYKLNNNDLQFLWHFKKDGTVGHIYYYKLIGNSYELHNQNGYAYARYKNGKVDTYEYWLDGKQCNTKLIDDNIELLRDPKQYKALMKILS